MTADLNQDGQADILAVNYDNSHVKRMIGDGHGKFTRMNDLLVGSGPIDLLDGDFNGDGRTDFVTVNRSGRSISVMLAEGMAGFSRTDVPVGKLPVVAHLATLPIGRMMIYWSSMRN